MSSFHTKGILIILYGFLFFRITVSGESKVKWLNTPQQSQSMTKADSAALLNNIGNLYFEKIEIDSAYLDSAMIYYRKAIEKAPLDGGIKFNLGIAYLMMDETEKADSLFKIGYVQCDSSREKVYQLLAMDYEKSHGDKGTIGSLTGSQLKESLESSFSTIKTKDKKSEKDKKTKEIKGNKNKKKPTRSAGPKSFDSRVVKNFLYWKF